MPTLTGSLADVVGTPLVAAQVRQAFVKAPAARGSMASGDRLVVSAPVPVTAVGSISLDLEPGPAVLVVDTYAGGPDVYELHVTADMTLLSEAVAESSPSRSWVESVMVQLRADAVDAAVRADAAAATAQSYRWVPQGDWVAGSYEAGDVVVYDGASYYAGSATSAEPPAAPWVPLGSGGGISDASELTGALTDQVDASAAMVELPSAPGVSHGIGQIIDILGLVSDSAVQGLSGKSDVGHTHPVTDLTATGTRSASTYLRGDGSWATPPNTTYEAVTTAAIDAGTEDVARLTTASLMRHAVQRWVTGSGATPVTEIGQALAAATTAASARATIGAGQEPWTGTQAAYDALGTKDPNRTYYIV